MIMVGKHRMRDLRVAEVEQALEKVPNSKRPRVQREAVFNFLTSAGANPDRYSAIQNMFRDKRLYGWNQETLIAIAIGIEMAAGGIVE
jgi:hypothetical protein